METLDAAYVDAALYAIGLATALLIYMPFSPLTIDLLMLPRGAQIWVHRHRHQLWVLVGACFAVLLVRVALGVAGEGWLWAVIVTAALLAIAFWSGYVPFVMTPPAHPRLLDGGEADARVTPDEVVLGLVEDGEARAYPRDAIARPHFFADTVGGSSFIVSYCILCNSGMAFRAELAGRPLDLECVTAFNNNIIYRDAARGNYLQQLDGKVIAGPDEGAALEPHPLVQARWADWKALHPETRLYHAPPATFRDRMVAGMLRLMIPIHRLARRKTPWHRIRGRLDRRLPAMSFVLGVEAGGETCGYPVAALRDSPVVCDTVGGAPIVVLYDPEREVADVFSRRLDDRTLTFASAPGADGAVARDEQTGSTWDVTGTAVGGELAGRSLARVPHYNKLFWFAWALFKPATRIHPEPEAA